MQDAIYSLNEKLDVYEKSILSEQANMAGDEFSAIDIIYMTYVAYFFKTGNVRPINLRPHLKNWWERLSAQESWQKLGTCSQVI